MSPETRKQTNKRYEEGLIAALQSSGGQGKPSEVPFHVERVILRYTERRENIRCTLCIKKPWKYYYQ